MSRSQRFVTIVIHHDGDADSRTYRVPGWVYATLTGGTVIAAILTAIGAALYMPIARTAVRVPGLNAEVERLTAENRQVHQLALTLDDLEARYGQVRTMFGANVLPAAVNPSDGPPISNPVYARLRRDAARYPNGPTLPNFWPLDSVFNPGIVTRGQTGPNDPGDTHPGVDIAVPSGTPIRAAGGGTVAEAGYDLEYGLFVLIDHPDGYRTMYGHAQRLLVDTGEAVNAGRIIALAGSTGRSTAPHLHFEKRRGDELIDPLTKVN